MNATSTLALGAALFVCAAASPSNGATMHAGELAHALDRASTTARVLYVAAHPDDENTRLLAHLANERHLVVAYLSLTRGGGGQNLIGAEQGELLDVIRTEELLAARALDGAAQRFSRMRDFGYSKSADETFAVWDREEALSDVVRVIRSFQPDVIVTRFDEAPPNHGHHTASAILAREAFAAAADPARFPEHGLPAWRTERLLHNLSTWRPVTIPPDALKVDVGGYDARLGMGYAELAALSRSQHKSQGFGAAGARGSIVEHLVHVAGSKPRTDPLEGVPLGWERYGKAARPLAAALDEARAALDRDRPERALPALARAHAAFDALPDEVRVREGRQRVEQVMLGAAGVFLRATSPAFAVAPGGSVEASLEAIARRPAEVELRRATFPGGEPIPGGALRPNVARIVTGRASVAPGAAISVPYWLERAPSRGRYEVGDPSLVGEPRGPAPLAVEVELAVAGRALRLRTPLVHAFTDRVQGERTRPVLVVPPATVTPLRAAVLPANGEPAPAVLRVRAGAGAVRGDVALELPAGWSAAPATIPVALGKAGDETTVRFEVKGPRGAAPIEIRPAIRVDGRAWSYREDVIDHPHVPLQVVLQPATLRVAPLELRRPPGLVGYVQGSGDSVAEDLAHVGFGVELLDDATLRGGDLSRYAAIVVGVRAYNARPAMRAAHARLMRYVEAGGTVVVQYNTTSSWAPLDQPIGPYPLELGGGRITDERAAMTPVDPDHPLLRAPNRIGDADFAGWVQERGIYFAARWDPRYQPLLRAADPGEPPQEGGTLVARHGAGRYVYTGLAFFRQLRAGVPGAYRLFANLIGGGRDE